MGRPRTMVPASKVRAEESDQVRAPSRDTFALKREVDQVSPWRVTKKSQTVPSGACQTTAFPSEWKGFEAIARGGDQSSRPRSLLEPYTAVPSAYSPAPPWNTR